MRMNSSYARLREKVDALLHEFWICFTILNHDYMYSLCQTFEHVLGSWARHKLCRRKLYRHSIKTSRFVFTICVIVQKDLHCHVNNGVQKWSPNTKEFFFHKMAYGVQLLRNAHLSLTFAFSPEQLQSFSRGWERKHDRKLLFSTPGFALCFSVSPATLTAKERKARGHAEIRIVSLFVPENFEESEFFLFFAPPFLLELSSLI